MEHWWADFKSIWLEHRPKAQTLAELQEQVRAGIMGQVQNVGVN